MRIGEVAAEAGVSAEALRYYEQRGLLDAPTRSASGYREYGPQAVRVVRFIRHAQDLGFTLADITDLLTLAGGGPDNCDQVRDLTNAKIAEVTEKLDRLTAIRDALGQLAATCDLPRADRHCPILASIDTPAGR
ncbi:heavy metal-responsive transcriptional regulator [Catellatospora methionotrophica]|uniref:heavy metal-responsive transcriptional regulator n=1 Tax=Catellatospora methionotrophica TaxID=121620 RepID=UPI003410E7FC